MKSFGFFEGMKYGKCHENFESYKMLKNSLSKSVILSYIKELPLSAICPMTTYDIFTGFPLTQAGIIEDGEFSFPIDFIHYYENYAIGIPIEYEEYIKKKI